MDYEYLNRLEKSLEDLYQLKYNALLMAKEYGDLRENQTWIKAIRTFGDLIRQTNNPVKKEENNDGKSA